MSTVDGRFTITFNGEIYNFRELRTALVAEGLVFHTGSDTEVILCLSAKYGPAVVDKLRGMFAFAIWDAVEKTCFLARDPLGIKPLCYTKSGASSPLPPNCALFSRHVCGNGPRCPCTDRLF